MSDAEFTDNMFFQEFEANLALIENGEDGEVVDVPVVAALVPAALQPDASSGRYFSAAKKHLRQVLFLPRSLLLQGRRRAWKQA